MYLIISLSIIFERYTILKNMNKFINYNYFQTISIKSFGKHFKITMSLTLKCIFLIRIFNK